MIPHQRVRSALRKLWSWGDDRKAALKRARIDRGQYRCESCRTVHGRDDVEVDHITAVGATPGARGSTTDWQGFMERLFCDADGLRVLCVWCHRQRTAAQREGAA